jgi:hypothetical protein
MSDPIGGLSGDFFTEFFTREPDSIDRVTKLMIETLRSSCADEQLREFSSKARVSFETPIEMAITNILQQAPKRPIKEHLKLCLSRLDAMDPDIAFAQIKEIIEVAKRASLSILDLELEKLNPILVAKISEEIINLSVLKDVIKRSITLKYLPLEIQTDIFLVTAVSQNWRIIQYIPKEKLSAEICLIAVMQNQLAISFVPEEKKTPEICLVMIKKGVLIKEHLNLCLDRLNAMNPDIGFPQIKELIEVAKGVRLKIVDLGLEKLNPALVAKISEEIVDLKILKNLIEGRISFQDIPTDKRTPEICLAAVNHYGIALQYVPEKMRTAEICLAAVNHYGIALQYVPEDKRSPEICLAAVSRSGEAIIHVPEDKRSPEICLAAVSRSWEAIIYIPEDKRSPQICLAAVRESGGAIIYIPKHERSPEICFTALISNIYYDDSIIKSIDDIGAALNFGLSQALSTDIERLEGSKIISNITNYRNPEIRDFLTILIIHQLKNNQIRQTIGRLNDSDLTYARLPLLCISSWLKGDTPIPESIVNFFKTHRKLIKSKETGSLQTILYFLMNLKKQSYPYIKKIDIFEKCLVKTTDKENRLKDFKESISRMNYSMALESINSKIIESITDFSSENLIRIAISFLFEKKFINNTPESIEQFKATFLSSRIPAALFIYIKGFRFPPPDFEKALKTFIHNVLNGTFKESRNEANLHKSYLSPELKIAWETGERRIDILDLENEAIFNPIEFFERKIKIDRHAGDKLDRFLFSIKSGEPIEDPNPLEALCLRLYRSRENAEQLSILKELKEILKSEEYLRLEFSNDIKAQIALLTKDTGAAKKIELVDSDDWEDLFLCGTEVLGSCQRIDGDPEFNSCLMGYVLDGKIRILGIKNKEGRILARSIFKLLLDKENRPVLFLEPTYPNPVGSEAKLIREFAQDRALKLGLPIYEHDNEGEPLHSEGNPAPFEYEDGGIGVTNGSYTISGALIPSKGGAGAGAL